jgi:amino acid adenylation domain-containing protein
MPLSESPNHNPPSSGVVAVPMSEMQRGIWFDEQLSSGSIKNHLSASVIIESELDVARFEQAIQHVVCMNPLLKARFTDVEGTAHQVVSTDVLVPVKVVDGKDWSAHEIRDELRTHHSAPFDLEQGPLIRFLLLEQADGGHVLSIAAHHLVADLWSLLLIWDEIRRFHDHGSIHVGVRTVDFGDFVRTENDLVTDGQGALEYYRQRFERWTSQGAGWTAPSDSATGLASIWPIALTEDEVAGVRASAKNLRVSVRSLVLAAFQTVLHREMHLENLVVGEFKANRSARSAAIVGCCVNVVPRFADFGERTTLGDLVKQVEEAERNGRQFDRYPFGALLRHLRPNHGIDPFFAAAFAWQRSVRVFDDATTAALAFGSHGDPVDIGSFRVRPVTMPARSATSPLTLLAGGGSKDLRLGVQFQHGAVTLEQVQRISKELRIVLGSLISDPSVCVADLDLRPDDERARDEAAWRQAVRPLDERVSTLDLIESHVSARADRLAVTDASVSITYGELGERSDLLASRLRHVGVVPGDLVGIALDRSVDMVVAIVGTWKCGAGYVPLDPGFPAERLQIVVDDAHLAAVVASPRVIASFAPDDEQQQPGLFAGLSVVDISERGELCDADAPRSKAIRPSGHDLAYVIFTSGSTGRPKGVAVEHRNVVNFLRAMAVRPGLSETDIMIAATTLSFDISVLELLLPLAVGAQVIVVDRAVAVDPVRLAAAMRSATIAQGTPTMWKMLVDTGWTCDRDFTILCGGEALPRDLGQALVERSDSVWNMYGPTETTVWSAVARLDTSELSGPFYPLGEPIDNTRLYVLDGERLALDGVAGELWIGGAGVARGYLTSAEMTAERFRPDPHFGIDERMYRTGDLVRREPNGTLSFLGRADGQIKLRGHRIELGEIESVLTRHEHVDQAVVVVREFGDDDQRLVGYVTPARSAEQADVDLPGVGALARSLLPPYMVPAAIVELERFPLTPNNKVDRNALPDPTVARPRRRTMGDVEEVVASETLRAVLQTYREVFGDDRIVAADDFFELGGHSLLATRICSRLYGRLDGDVSVRMVFENATPHRLALAIDGRIRTGAPVREVDEQVNVIELSGSPAMSFSQERMLFLHQLNPSDTSYNLAGAVRVRGALDQDALRRACTALVERHTGLRTTFQFVDSEPQLVVHEPFDVELSVTDWREAVDVDRMDGALSNLSATARTPFDLRELALFRIEVHVLSSNESLVGIVMHHVIADQWSFGVLARDLGALYEAARAGRTLELAEDAPRPEHYARWHRDQLLGETIERQLAYWRDQLRDLPIVEYPSDRPRTSIRAGRRSGTIAIDVPQSVVETVRAISSAEQATEFMTLFAAYASVLHGATGADDIPIGVPIANRHWLASEGLITSLVNTLVMRVDLSGQPDFRELVRRVREMSLDAYSHQDMPFERLVVELMPRRDTLRSPLFQYFFNVQNAPLQLPDLEELQVEVMRVPSPGAQFDISMTVDIALTGTITLDYSADLFDEESMTSLLESYVDVLETLVDAPPAAGRRDSATTQPSRRALTRSAPAADPQCREFEPPRDGTEQQLAAIWERELGVSGISRHDNFFDLGGYSLLAVRIFNEIENLTDRRPPMITLFDAPTIADFAMLLDSEGWLSPWTSLVRVSGAGTRTPVFYVAPFLISALSFHDLARDLGGDIPFYVLQPQGLEDEHPIHDRVEDMADHYVRELKTVQPHGPYVIGGHCAGGWVAFEMVRQLEAAGDLVDQIIVVDVAPPGVSAPPVRLVSYLWSRVVLYGRSGRVLDAVRWNLGLRVQRLRNSSEAHADARRAIAVRRRHADAHSRYQGGTVRSDLTLIRSDEWAGLADKVWHLQWSRLTSGSATTVVIPGAHSGLLMGKSQRALAIALREALNR